MALIGLVVGAAPYKRSHVRSTPFNSACVLSYRDPGNSDIFYPGNTLSLYTEIRSTLQILMLIYFILFCFILFYFILFYFTSFYSILFYLYLFYFIFYFSLQAKKKKPVLTGLPVRCKIQPHALSTATTSY
jgi:hypothetical protein